MILPSPKPPLAYPKPKPWIRPKLKPLRLERKRVVTIGAGFLCTDGVVLCADTQETINDLTKTRASKLMVKEAPDRKLVIAGAGDSAFIDKLIELIWCATLSANATIDDVSDMVKDTVTETHRRYKEFYHVGMMPTAELLFGVWVQGQGVRLYTTEGPIVNRVDKTQTVGVGWVLADYIIDRMFRSSMSAMEARTLAAYMLLRVKEYVAGCGGDSEIVILQNDGAIHKMRDLTASRLASVISRAEIYLPNVMIAMAMGHSKREFDRILKDFCDFLRECKTEWDEDRELWGDTL